MNKSLKLASLIFCAGLMLAIGSIKANARLTAQPASAADIWCMGPSGAEVCIDSSGNLIPTTASDTTLGTSSLPWATVYADDMTIGDDLAATGDLYQVAASTQALSATASGNGTNTISVAGKCGGIVRVSAPNATVTVAGFTAPASAPTGCIFSLVVVTGPGLGGFVDIATSATFSAPLQGGLVVGLYPEVGIRLGTNDAIIVGNIGARWVALGTVVANSN